MKLQKFIKNKKVKNSFLVSIVALVLVIGGVTLYRTFAFYEQKESFDVLVGVVPQFTKIAPNAIQDESEENEISSDEIIQDSVPSISEPSILEEEQETNEIENTTIDSEQEDSEQNVETINEIDSIE